MASGKFDNMWKIMSKYIFENNFDTTDNLLCTICHKLMIDACQTACGCQFCYKCISDYIGDENKYCPGGNEECKEESLVIERDVMKNIRMNNRISKIKVKCPNKSCQSTIELRNMHDHLRVCTPQPTRCPYLNIGCNKVLDHDQGDNNHTELLMEWIINLRNELDDLKAGNFENIEQREKNVAINDVMKIIEKQQDELSHVSKELRKKENRILILEKESQKKDNQINQFEETLQEIKREFENKIVDITVKLKQREQEIDSQIHNLQMELNQCETDLKSKSKSRCNKLKAEVALLSMRMDNNVKDSEFSGLVGLNCSEDLLNKNFIWSINHISKVRVKHQTIFSEVFYMNNYKFCLSALVGGNNLSLWCYIMKGENDKYLAWPMKMTVVLSILNQHTQEVFKSQLYRYDTYKSNYRVAFDRPTAYRNEYSIGSNLFAHLSDIKSNKGIIINDSILVSFHIPDL